MVDETANEDIRAEAADTLAPPAVDKAPDAPEVRYHLAMAQLRSGEAQPAQQNLEAAVKSTRAFDDSDNARAELAQLKHSVGSG